MLQRKCAAPLGLILGHHRREQQPIQRDRPCAFRQGGAQERLQVGLLFSVRLENWTRVTAKSSSVTSRLVLSTLGVSGEPDHAEVWRSVVRQGHLDHRTGRAGNWSANSPTAVGRPQLSCRRWWLSSANPSRCQVPPPRRTARKAPGRPQPGDAAGSADKCISYAVNCSIRCADSSSSGGRLQP